MAKHAGARELDVISTGERELELIHHEPREQHSASLSALQNDPAPEPEADEDVAHESARQPVARNLDVDREFSNQTLQGWVSVWDGAESRDGSEASRARSQTR